MTYRKGGAESVTVSLSQLEGAAIMNNTFCLAIFLFLIWLQVPVLCLVLHLVLYCIGYSSQRCELY